MAEEVKVPTTKKTDKRDYLFAVGRRREAVARVRLYETVKDDLMFGDTPIKKGDILVNAMPIAKYFGGDIYRHVYSEPLRITNTQNKFTWSIKVDGGGKSGQLQAVVAGIANALNKLDEKAYRSILKKKGFMTRDPRVRQRRKVGMGGKSRRKLQSPKR